MCSALQERYPLHVQAVNEHRELTPSELSFGAGYIDLGPMESWDNQLRVFGEGYEASSTCSEFDGEAEMRVQHVLLSCRCLRTGEA